MSVSIAICAELPRPVQLQISSHRMMAHFFALEIVSSSSTNESVSPESSVSLHQSAGRSPIAHSFGGSPSAVFWYIQLPQTVQFQLLLTFVMFPGGPNAPTPEAARSPCGGTLDGFPTSSRQASQGCI